MTTIGVLLRPTKLELCGRDSEQNAGATRYYAGGKNDNGINNFNNGNEKGKENSTTV